MTAGMAGAEIGKARGGAEDLKEGGGASALFCGMSREEAERERREGD